MKKRHRKTTLPTSSFNGIANKFDSNIYGTSKGRLRHALLLHHLAPFLEGPPLRVLDAGGGTGMMSEEFAKTSHCVTLVDMSDDVLSIAKERLDNFSNVVVRLGEIHDIQGSFDLILCHAVLEWTQDPQACIQHLLSLLPVNGILSLSFFNQDAKIFNNLLYGNFDYVKGGLSSKNTVRLNPHNAQKPSDIIGFLSQLDSVEIIKQAGIRCIHDYMPDKDKIENDYETLLEMECKYGVETPYLWLGKYFYLQIRKVA